MTKHFQDYVWREGVPYGIKALEENKINNSHTTFKIISDPYRKRISIEKYLDSQFIELIYDSLLLDFRSLKSLDHTAWQKEIIKEAEDKTLSLIRNQDDRIIFFEECFFVDNYCRSCRLLSPQGTLLSLHQMHYQALNDSFDGVTLFDSNGHVVMYKLYAIDEMTGEFTEIIEEGWNDYPASLMAKA